MYWQCYEDHRVHKRTTTLSEVMTRIRQDHQQQVLRAACAEVANGASVDELVKRYLGNNCTEAA